MDVSPLTQVPLWGICLLAFYVACTLGANDVANSMGTSVGSKAITLRQAILIAGILEFSGAVLFGGGVSETLATGVVKPEEFIRSPELFQIGMVAVLLAAGIWLQIATRQGLPVASSHAVVGAIAGFSAVAAGVGAVAWKTVGLISSAWVITPLISGGIAALFYSLIKHWILDHPHPSRQLQEWTPWLSFSLIAVFGTLVLPQISRPLQEWIEAQFHLNLPAHDLTIAIGGVAVAGLTWFSWQPVYGGESVLGNRESGKRGENPAHKTEITRFDTTIETRLARFQVLSACFVAFAHGSNDVGNTVAPLAVVAFIRNTGTVPIGEFHIPLWILVVGGGGIATGLAIWGKNVISTVGENIIPLAPSAGFCAELATATTVLLASKIGLPVSTSHALVGGVVGIGLVRGLESIQFGTVRAIALAWLITVPTAAGLAAGGFLLLRSLFGIG
ncbi:inorganic phosphate transporter [Lyngbya sp. CCY1209]|uniref:inorganic phosphate transporter n=1 Tax=Lyngbya sp. CCY1209 TaxID=2886103 RepID=UPI002D2073F9|nr:inorganic phosphate transporter [Lyngbya sp. CCY1209]MEB3882932.1 inorganic phosphate transporter [Lyngbya sp. CCY1209]